MIYENYHNEKCRVFIENKKTAKSNRFSLRIIINKTLIHLNPTRTDISKQLDYFGIKLYTDVQEKTIQVC